MSQIEDIRPAAMARAAEARAADSAAAAIRPAQPGRFHDLSDGDLADAHRGHSFALQRAQGKLDEARNELAAIEAELTRRNVTSAHGKLGYVRRRTNDGLLDLPRIRAEMGADFCRRFAVPGSGTYWRSGTLTDAERAAAKAGG